MDVDQVLRQWAAERPDLDVSPMSVIGRLSQASRMVDAQLQRTFAKHGLDAPSFDVLATLRRAGAPYELTPTQLTQAAMVTSGAITQRLDRLEKRGLVARTRSPDDGRAVRVSLTREGHAAIERALPDHVDTEQRLLAAFSPQQRAELADTLRRLITSISAAGPSSDAAT